MQVRITEEVHQEVFQAARSDSLERKEVDMVHTTTITGARVKNPRTAC